MIDKGKVHGIEREMGVTASGGIVGQVVEVSDYFSTIMSVLNIHSRISVRVKSSGQIGTLIWNGKNYRIGTLIDIPTHSKLNVGDTIVTSGYSHIFPEGIQVGTVKDFRINPGDNFYTADISYFVDYNKIYHVFVIRNIFRKDQNKLDANKNKTP
jgi:rod shape-determining protein MreC